MQEFKGSNGSAYVYKGDGHDWTLEFWPKYSRKHPRKTVRRTFKGPTAKSAAIIVAKQMVGIFKQP
jgi:hypothetical protein